MCLGGGKKSISILQNLIQKGFMPLNLLLKSKGKKTAQNVLLFFLNIIRFLSKLKY